MFAYCNNQVVDQSDPTGECVHGDGYYYFEFAAHSLDVGDVCPYCKKRVDEMFFAHPQEWTDLALSPAFRDLPGESISAAIRCGVRTANIKEAIKNTIPTKRPNAYVDISVCFVAGTPVKTEGGDKPIEEIRAGDSVWAYDDKTGEYALKTVVRTFVNETYELVNATVNGEMVQATPGHPFYILNDDGRRSHDTLGNGWIRAKDLKAGDVILLLDGTRARIESVVYEQLHEPVKVYNFEVEDYHTYFVGHDGWLVHNVCKSLNDQLAMEAAQSNPAAGRVIMTNLNNPIYAGCVKMAQFFGLSTGNVDIHYIYNPNTGTYYDYKIAYPW